MRRRLRSEDGFGLIELLIAMTVLSLGILALVAAFSSGTAALMRASQIGTASTLADKQMELYRGVPYDWIVLDTTAVTTASSDAVYQGDQALSGGLSNYTEACPAGAPSEACAPIQNVTGPDNRTYRVDTYVTLDDPTDSGAARDVRVVTVVVREGGTNRNLVRQVSTFDELAG
jgi:prepilin-type N-terminal cleavage/methylation domain-containing protein